MSWLSYLLPVTLERTSSVHNHDIRVIEDAGKLRLLVNGSRQSDPSISALWTGAIQAFGLAYRAGVNDILVLGVGGGSVITILAGLFPASRITAVDIDPAILSIAKRFFRLGDLSRVKLIHADAGTFVRNAKSRRYDMVVVDLFIGRIIPDFVSSPAWHRMLSRILRPDGVVLINYLQENGYKKKSDLLKDRLRRHFSVVQDHADCNNRFFLGST